MPSPNFQPEGPGSEQQPAGSNPTDSNCNQDLCITCSDSATIARIVELLPGGLARVEPSGDTEEINVELIDAMVGDRVLVHAGIAIGKL